MNNLYYFLSYLYVLLFSRKNTVSIGARISPYFLLRKIKTDIVFDRASIGRDVKVERGVRFFEDPIVFGNVSIGKYTSINGPATRICSRVNHINIGSFCSIASNVVIQEYDHEYRRATTYAILSNFFDDKSNVEVCSKGPIIIEDDVWIGAGVVILSGVTIGRGAIVAAGSVVTRSVKPYSIVAGSPATTKKMRFSSDSIQRLQQSAWWTWDEEKLAMNKDFFCEIFD